MCVTCLPCPHELFIDFSFKENAVSEEVNFVVPHNPCMWVVVCSAVSPPSPSPSHPASQHHPPCTNTLLCTNTFPCTNLVHVTAAGPQRTRQPCGRLSTDQEAFLSFLSKGNKAKFDIEETEARRAKSGCYMVLLYTLYNRSSRVCAHFFSSRDLLGSFLTKQFGP